MTRSKNFAWLALPEMQQSVAEIFIQADMFRLKFQFCEFFNHWGRHIFVSSAPPPGPRPHLFSLHRIMYDTAPVTQFLSRGHDRWATNRYVSSTSQLIHMLTYGLW